MSEKYFGDTANYLGTPENNENWQESEKSGENIEDLTRDINNSLDDTPSEKVNKEKESIKSMVPKDVLDGLLLLVVFFLLFNNKVRGFINQNIPKLNCDTELCGVAMYGLVLTLAYKVLRKYILD